MYIIIITTTTITIIDHLIHQNGREHIKRERTNTVITKSLN